MLDTRDMFVNVTCLHDRQLRCELAEIISSESDITESRN